MAMEHKFDFNNIGKRMPYTVPDHFFDNFEQQTMSLINHNGTAVVAASRPAPWRLIIRSLTAAAAVVAIIFCVAHFAPSKSTKLNTSVEQAFAELSISDQEYLIDTYNDVTYISDQL